MRRVDSCAIEQFYQDTHICSVLTSPHLLTHFESLFAAAKRQQQSKTLIKMSGKGITNNAPCCNYPGTQDTRSVEHQILDAKMARAMASGPRQITKDATIAEWQRDGSYTVLREGTNQWTCFPGNENFVGNVPMCCDDMGLQWAKDIYSQKERPTNTAPGLIYMLCGATQRSLVDPFDNTITSIPIGPHYMIIWPYDSKRDGMPNDIRDAGAWVAFDGTPYAHLHICGSPWEGTVYHPEKASAAIWTMRYAAPNDENVDARSH